MQSIFSIEDAVYLYKIISERKTNLEGINKPKEGKKIRKEIRMCISILQKIETLFPALTYGHNNSEV